MDADETVLRPLPNNHEPWLKNAEQKLTKAIEVLHDLYSEIFQEGTKKKVLKDETKRCQCGPQKEVLENRCKELELEKERCTTDFDAKVHMWREKFHELKNRYKVLREAVSPEKRKKSHRRSKNNEGKTSSKSSGQNIVCDGSKTKTSHDDVDERKETAMVDNATKVTAQEKPYEVCYVADTEDVDMTRFTEDSKLHDVPKAAYTNTTSVDLIGVVDTKDTLKGVETSLDNIASKEVELTKKRSFSGNEASMRVKGTETEFIMNESTKLYPEEPTEPKLFPEEPIEPKLFPEEPTEPKLFPEEPTEPSWKSSSVILRGKHNSRVVYHDKITTADTKTIDHFFKPKPLKISRKITSRRSKRQKSEADLDSPEKKRSKETKPNSSKHQGIIDVDKSDYAEKQKINKTVSQANKVNEVSVEGQSGSLQASRNCIVKVDQLDANNKQNNGRDNRLESSKQLSTAVSKRKDVVKTTLKYPELPRKATCIKNDTTETISLVEVSETNRLSKTPVESTTRRHQFQSLVSSKPRPIPVDSEVTCWDVEEHVGLPSLASTPVIPMDNDHKHHSNGKNFDDTMWSAPQSPSVVRSIFSTPENLKDGPVSTCIEKAYEDQPKPSLKDPVKEPIPVLLTDSQSYLEEVSRDSPHQTKGLLYKTSEADLSCDMFNGETASSIAERGDDTTQNDSTSGEEDLAERDDVLREKEAKKVERPNKTESFQSFQKKVTSDVNYKYSTVVRKRDQRDKMDGFECPECAAWYADEPDCEEKRKHLKLVCRHKAVSSPPPDTPEDFWSVGFPQTPEYMGKRYMLNENDTLPTHAKPMERRRRRDRNAKDDGGGET